MALARHSRIVTEKDKQKILFVKSAINKWQKSNENDKKLGNFNKNGMIAKNLTISYTQIVFFVIQYLHLSEGQVEDTVRNMYQSAKLHMEYAECTIYFQEVIRLWQKNGYIFLQKVTLV